MTTTTHHKHAHRHNKHDLYDDVEKIKAAMYGAAQNATGKAGDMLAGSLDDVKKQTLLLKKNVENYTAEKPLKTLGITLFVGIVIGYFLHR